jgi:nucleotide-binding universal stress UspA family protein
MTEREQTAQRGAVIVGVDGSAGASAALLWAAAEARLRQTRLRVIHAWRFSYPEVAGYGWGGSIDVLPRSGMSGLHRAAEGLLDEATAHLAAEGLDVNIECEAIEGDAADVLVRTAGEGDLLVVGSRGHGGFVGLLLGSVSGQCAHHAPCPVVIVHAPKRALERDDVSGKRGVAA